jgi:hypothetical protein
MTLSKPPALATWMLEHLVLGIDGDALAGDLLEEFRHRRSVAWYWRQVLMAIFVGFSKELGRQWRAAGFALAWTVGSAIAWRVLFQSSHFRGLLGWTIMHDWPESIVLFISLEISPQFLMWWFGLGFYLVMIHSFSARRFARGVLVSLFFGLLPFAFDLSGWERIVTGTVMQDLPRQAIPLVYSAPSFLVLLLSICATLPSAAIKRAKKIRISQ